MTTAGSLALVGARAPQDSVRRAATARSRRSDHRQDQSQRVGQLSFQPFDQRLERTRRTNQKPLRARSQSLRLEFGYRRRDRANLAPLGVGTETDGSVVCPSRTNSLVGIKPTVGLISRAGIVPISHSQDTAGPMARTVTDAAILLGALTGSRSRNDAIQRQAPANLSLTTASFSMRMA